MLKTRYFSTPTLRNSTLPIVRRGSFQLILRLRLFQLFGEVCVNSYEIIRRFVLPTKESFPKNRCMSTPPLFPLPDGLEITSISQTPEEVLVRVTLERQTGVCPLCGVVSATVHSSYRRKPRDLPCVGRPIRLLLTGKKFFCRNPHCARTIFVERLDDFLAVSSRLTMRLRSSVQESGFA